MSESGDYQGNSGEQDRDRDRRSNDDRQPSRSEELPPGALVGKLYVGQLGDRATRSDLEDLFRPFGTLRRVDVKAGYGFVEFEAPEEASAALNALDGTDFHGSALKVQFSLDRKRQPGEGRCFICNVTGHWARECPRKTGGRDDRRSPRRDDYDRRRSPPRYSRDYPPRDYDRDRDYGRDRERDYGRDRERDYGYPPRESRDYYRGPPPPAEYRSERDRYPPAPSSYDRDRRY